MLFTMRAELLMRLNELCHDRGVLSGCFCLRIILILLVQFQGHSFHRSCRIDVLIEEIRLKATPHSMSFSPLRF